MYILLFLLLCVGVNCIDYYPGGDKPYLLSGADDRTVKIWDYQTKGIYFYFFKV